MPTIGSTRRRRLLAGSIIPALALCLGFSHVSAQASLEGRWAGRLGGSLRLVLEVTRTADSLYFGSWISVDQGGSRIPIDRLDVIGDSVHMEMRAITGKYDARFSPDRTRLIGMFSQGRPIPLEMTRSAEAPVRDAEPIANPEGEFGIEAALSVPVRPTLFAGGGKQHLVYEIHVQNYSGAQMVIRRLELLSDAKTLASFEGNELNAIIAQYRVNVVDKRAIPASGFAIIHVWLTLDSAAPAPKSVRHRITVGSKSLEGTVAVEPAKAIVIGPPLRGGEWVALNGPGNDSFHRRALISLGGHPAIAQRFAIDWVKSGPTQRMFEGNELDNKAYFGYGADVIAVADAVVADVKDGIPENVPGDNRAVPITLQTVVGNSVTLDLGLGRYAVYAHLTPGSLRVKKGDRVKRGQVLALLGNSGNSTGPHLHFHITNGTAGLASEGLPYVIDSWELQHTPGVWERRRNEIPMANARVRFP